MAVKPTKALLAQSWEMYQAGASSKEIKAATGLNEGQHVAYRWHQQMVANPKLYGGFITAKTDTALAAAIVQARAAGQSWGLIFVRCQLPEGRVRAIFKAASGMDSRGLRNGNGGRYVGGEPRFYVGQRAKGGTELVPGKPLAEQVPSPNAPVKYRLPEVAAGFAPKGKVRTAPKRAPKPKPEAQAPTA